MIIRKNDKEVRSIESACQIAAEVLKMAGKLVGPGITTEEVDRFIEDEIRKAGAKPAFKGYRGYRHASCLSINDEVVHGIPSKKVLSKGDIIGIDVGTIIDGYYGDVAETFPVGEISKKAKTLLSVTRECLERGIKQCRKGKRIGDVSSAIETYAVKNGYSVVRDMFGHGVGKNLHEDPLVPNFGSPGTGPKLEPGMVFAIEPMLNTGGHEIETLDDGWTVVTADRGLSAHFEHTVLITEGDPRVLTRIQR